jgi:gamma-glutamylcyclotransferase (GGCT)/AIG2-like uncharacterized protein YtfP
MHLFVYGTLMDSEIMTQVSGAPHRYCNAKLHHYVRKMVRGEVYPAIIKQEGGSVDGIIYCNVSSTALNRLDRFEGDFYVRTGVETICDDGEHVRAQTYVITADSAHHLSNEDWSYDNFITNHKQRFQTGYKGYDEHG